MARKPEKTTAKGLVKNQVFSEITKQVSVTNKTKVAI